jgi:hypothetical protein
MKLATWLLAVWCIGAMAAQATLAMDAGQRNAAEPQGDPVFDPPTLHCLGAYWLVRGDDNRNAHVEVHFRKAGTQDWQRGPDMLRVIHGPFSDEGDKIKEPAVQIHEGWMFAGSVLFLEPGTKYEVKYNLIDPDGGSTEKTLTASTRSEPAAPSRMRERHVVPGSGGGSGTQQDPFKGLAAADASAQAGDFFLVHKGTYDGPFHVTHDGEEGKPIIYRGAGDGEAIIDGQSKVGPAPGFAMEGTVVALADAPAQSTVPATAAAKKNKKSTEPPIKGRHDVWLENLTICNGRNGVWLPGAQRIVIRHCHLYNMIEGIYANQNHDAKQGYFFIADNLIEGVMPWPATKDQWDTWPESRGIWITGMGNIACYNRIRHWKDGMDVDESPQCVGCDFHNNDVSECFDDGCEMDGSDRNNRNYCNRYCNSLTGVSLQPTHGGPVYVYRNVMYNTQTEAFKLHNNPSGAILFQNTCVKNNTSPLLMCWTSRSISNVHAWNNLYLGQGSRAADYDPALFDCTFDNDGFGGFGNFGEKDNPVFMKWAGVMYPKLEDVRAKSPYESHCVIVDPKTAFASGLQAPTDHLQDYDNTIVDFRLKPGCAAIGAGQIVLGYETGPGGAAPSLGAYEAGAPLTQYGPRPEK